MLRSTALKAQDVLVACKLYSLAEVVRPASDWTYSGLSGELGISLSETYNSFERCCLAQLIVTVRDRRVVSKRHFYELLAVAVPRIFYAARGGLEVGLPTSVYAPALRSKFEGVPGAIPSVWPCDHPVDREDRRENSEGLRPEDRACGPLRPEGRVGDPLRPEGRACGPRVGDPLRPDLRVRGESISPIYPSAPEAAAQDSLLYELLALVDVIRIGDTRSRNLAVAILEKKILGKGSQAQGLQDLSPQ